MASLVALILLLASSVLRAQDQPAAPDQDWDARLVSVRMDVTVYTLDDPDGVPGAEGMPLEAGDRIRTGEDSSAEIGLKDQSIITLRPNSDFTLNSLSQRDSKFSLSLGGLLAKIRSLGTGRLSVHTPVAVAAVRGTEFGVELDPAESGTAHFGVFDEGRLEVIGNNAPADTEFLIANQETRVMRGAGPQVPYQLRRFIESRRRVRSLRQKIQVMRRNYRPMAGAERRAVRRKMIVDMREKRRALIKTKQERKERRMQRRGPSSEEGNKEQMEKRRQRIRERIRPRGQP